MAWTYCSTVTSLACGSNSFISTPLRKLWQVMRPRASPTKNLRCLSSRQIETMGAAGVRDTPETR